MSVVTEIPLKKIAPTQEGPWVSTKTYPALTEVYHERTGSTWLSLVANRGVEPGTDNAVWMLRARGGTSITYADLTAAQKEELARPATEQAQRAIAVMEQVLAAISSLDPQSDNNVAALAARLEALSNRTSLFKGIVTDVDALAASTDVGLYYYAGTSTAKGFVSVSTDNNGNITQHFLSSSTPVYTDGAVSNWVPGPSLLTRTYRNNAWSAWQNRIEQNVWLTQAEYDTLVATDAIDPNVEYNIYEG